MLFVNKLNFKNTVLNHKGIILVDFYSDWCNPCKKMIPILESLEKKYKVVKLNVEDDPEISEEYSVDSLPTLIFFKDGEVYKRLIGTKNKQELEEIFESEKKLDWD